MPLPMAVSDDPIVILQEQLAREAMLVSTLGDVRLDEGDTVVHRLLALSEWLRHAAPQSARLRATV